MSPGGESDLFCSRHRGCGGFPTPFVFYYSSYQTVLRAQQGIGRGVKCGPYFFMRITRTILTMRLMAMILGMTDMTYDPGMICKPTNPLTILFYAGYTVLCLMPLGLELWTEYQFRKARESI